MHYYKFNVASWSKDTAHLTTAEEGVYLRLINYYYDTEKPIPLKTDLVLRKLRLVSESDTVGLILSEFFTKSKNGWTHNHCHKLIGEYQKMAERNKKNAKLGGRPKNNNLSKPTGKRVETHTKPTGIPNQELETINQELETKESKPSGSRSKKFVKPTVDEILTYMQERNHNSRDEAERFFDYWESIGWVRNKTPMKDWKSSVRTWLKNSKPVISSDSQPDWMRGVL